MNICLPYTYLVNDLFRCLFADLHIAFTEAPVPGKYTVEMGDSLSEGTLCQGLQSVLGSLVECAYLGADTALVFAPCASCSAQRIGMKLQNALLNSKRKMNIILLEDTAASQKQFWAVLKAVSPVSALAFMEAKSKFYACAALLKTFVEKRNEASENATNRYFIQKVLGEIRAAHSLLQLKIVLAAFTKKMDRLEKRAFRLRLEMETPPYEHADYFYLESENGGERMAAFFQKKRRFGAATSPLSQEEKCSLNVDVSTFFPLGEPLRGRE